MSFETDNLKRRWFLTEEDAKSFLDRYNIKKYDKYVVVEYGDVEIV